MAETEPLLRGGAAVPSYLHEFAHYWSSSEAPTRDPTPHLSLSSSIDDFHPYVELLACRPTRGLVYSWRHLHAYARQDDRPSRFWPGAARRQARRTHILRDVNGEARPGELLAVLGASGAGKTTLLDALSFRGRVSCGSRLLNGRQVTPGRLRALAAYVQQDDLFVGALTVREHLVFHALLRMEKQIAYFQRMRRVDQVISEFSLTDCQDVVIGIPGRIKGISGGERKRLAFASEVLTDPPLMLCDEPTSGLDSFMALTVMSTLKAMAGKGKTVVATVHQPSSEMYALFDKVLLMAEGRVAFLGTPQEALDFFSSLGATCPEGFNPADFFVQQLAVEPDRETECWKNIEHVCDCFQRSDRGLELADIPSKVESPYDLEDEMVGYGGSHGGYKAGWVEQFRAVFWRSWLSVIKEPVLIRMRMLQTVMISLMVGLVFFGQNLDQDGVMNINGALIIFITNMTFQNVFAVITVFCSEVPVFMRENLNGMYRTDVYFLSKTLAELPVFMAIPCLFTVISYFLVNLNPAPDRFFTAIVIATLVTCVATSFGYLVSCVSPSISVAMSMAAPGIFPFLLYGGFFINVGSVPWPLQWLTYVSWFRFGNEAMMINQWADVKHIDCSTAANDTCPTSGHVVLEIFDFEESDIVTDLLGLVALIVVFRALALLSLLFRTYRGSR